MADDPGLERLEEVRGMLKAEASGREHQVVRDIRKAVEANKMKDAFSAEPHLPHFIGNRTDGMHPTVLLAFTAMNNTLFHVGEASNVLNRVHVMGVYDLLLEAGVNERCLNMIGCMAAHVNRTSRGKVKIGGDIKGFVEESERVYKEYKEALTYRTVGRMIRERRTGKPGPATERRLRRTEIKYMTNELQAPTKFREAVEKLRKPRNRN